jgi:hypothetical protein
MPKPWRLKTLLDRLWEEHGHPGRYCEIGSRGIGSCALAEARSAYACKDCGCSFEQCDRAPDPCCLGCSVHPESHPSGDGVAS